MSLHDAIHISAGRYMVTSNAYDFLAMLKSHGYIVIPSNPSNEITEAIHESMKDRRRDLLPLDTFWAAVAYAAVVTETLHDLA